MQLLLVAVETIILQRDPFTSQKEKRWKRERVSCSRQVFSSVHQQPRFCQSYGGALVVPAVQPAARYNILQIA